MKIINEAVELAPVDAVQPHPRNPRQGDVGAIHESIEANGFYGAVVAQRSTGFILAGNHRWQAARHAGATEVPVIWVDVDDDHALRILLADNRTNDLATYDDSALASLLQELADAGNLAGTGYDGDALDDLLADLSGGEIVPYTQKVETPTYEPHGPRPPLRDLRDEARADELRREIDATPDVPDDVRDFLRAAAGRHTVFRYDRIAEYYAHAPAEVQRLMEASALVIIDFKQAIDRGFVRLHEDVVNAFERDFPGANPEDDADAA